MNFAAVSPPFASQKVLCLLHNICDYLIVAFKELCISIKFASGKKKGKSVPLRAPGAQRVPGS